MSKLYTKVRAMVGMTCQYPDFVTCFSQEVYALLAAVVMARFAIT